ncbi:hypothetical protein L6R29_07970 [Myxococcota bacterium]|nr:hypothetical protein [Myxococcota bacterium]
MLPTSGEVIVNKDEFFYKLPASTASFQVWTQPTLQKATPEATAPSAQSDAIRIYSAKREFEPFQVLLRSTTPKSIQIQWQTFPNLGASHRMEMALVGYSQGKAESLTPIVQGQTLTIAANSTLAVWGTLFVPADAPTGAHETTLTLQDGTTAHTLTLRLHVFAFQLPAETHFRSQMNLSIQPLMDGKGTYQEQLDRAKRFLIEHRFTPKSVPWPSGFGASITWENNKNPQRCKQFYDEPDESPPYSIGHLARRYGLGQGWNDGVGFPTMMLFQFVDNATPRPSSFCGVARGTGHEGTTEYNNAYGAYLKALQDYLAQASLLDKGYHYVMNEPQNDADHALAAHLCRLIRQAAPKLKIAISEEAKPQIYADSKGACGYDIWIAHIPTYAPYTENAWQRHLQHGEKTWWYSLPQDSAPFPNPTRPENDGIEVRVIPWLAWRFRAEGWAYYDVGSFLTNGKQPTVRFALLREGFEDYEYLWLINQQRYPIPKQTAIPDESVNRLVSSLTSYNRDPAALTKLRLEMGRYLGKERTDLPLIKSADPPRPRQPYYLNFQDPNGEPKASPLQVNGKTYLKIGWDKYDEKRGYGWFGPYISDPKITRSQWLADAPVNPLQRSILYDDYGRKNTFEIDLPNGLYKVTVSVGWHNKTYRYHQVWIEGSPLIDNETTDANNQYYIVRSVDVDLKDGKLTLEMGGKSPKSNDFEYTMLNFLDIELR